MTSKAIDITMCVNNIYSGAKKCRKYTSYVMPICAMSPDIALMVYIYTVYIIYIIIII